MVMVQPLCEMNGCEYDGSYGDDFIRIINVPHYGELWMCEDCHQELDEMQAYRPTDADSWVAISVAKLKEVK